MSGSNAGSIYQTIATTIGQQYTVRFDMAGNPDSSPVTKSMSVDVNGLGAQTYTFDTTGATYANMGWTAESYVFTATGTSSVLTFTGLDNGSPYGAALDNVSIAVPEPATWAMMLMGMGGLGIGLRTMRRKQLGVLAAV